VWRVLTQQQHLLARLRMKVRTRVLSLTCKMAGGKAGEGMQDIHSRKPSSVFDSDRASHWRSSVDIQLGAKWQFCVHMLCVLVCARVCFRPLHPQGLILFVHIAVYRRMCVYEGKRHVCVCVCVCV